jgi:hypothetical protein
MYGPSYSILWKIMHIDLFGFLTPNTACILEVADQLLLLGVDTECRLAGGLMLSSLCQNVLELEISLWLFLSDKFFDIGPQSVVVCPEQSTDHRQADLMTLLTETALDISQTAVEPLVATHRVTGRMRRYNIEEHSF